MRYEHKTESVPFKSRFGKGDAVAKARALAPFEVDGWKGRVDDLGNMHKSTGDGTGYHVVFTRHVPLEDP